MEINFGEKLKELRKLKNASQRIVAANLGITKSAYNNYEQGIRQPSYEILIKICKYFCASADFLLGLDENPQ